MEDTTLKSYWQSNAGARIELLLGSREEHGRRQQRRGWLVQQLI